MRTFTRKQVVNWQVGGSRPFRRGRMETVWLDGRGRVLHRETVPLEDSSGGWGFDWLDGFPLPREEGRAWRRDPNGEKLVDAEVVDGRGRQPLAEQWQQLRDRLAQLGQRLQRAARAAWFELTR